MLILVLKSHQFIFKPTAQVLTGRSGPLPARRVKKANLGLIFAACGGFCFSTWPCLGSLVEGQTAWTTWDSGPKLNASAFFCDRGVAAASTALSLAVAYRCELELLEAERGKLPRDGTSMVLVMIYS